MSLTEKTRGDVRAAGPSLWSELGLLRTGAREVLGRAKPYHTYFASLAQQFGDLVRIPAPDTMYQVTHPDLVRQVMSKDAAITGKGSGQVVRMMRRALGNGLVASEGEVHDRNRRIVAASFTRERITWYAGVFTEVIADVDQDWNRRVAQGRTSVDMAAEMSRMTLRAVGRALFGVDLLDRSSALFDAIGAAMRSLEYSRSPLAPIILHPRAPVGRRFGNAMNVIHGVVDELIAEHRTHPESFAGDALSRLLDASDSESGGLSDQQLRDEVTNLLLAGHETTANLLSWAWYFLDADPEAAALLHGEVDALPGPAQPTDAFEPALPVTRALLAETLRMRPPAWFIVRVYQESQQVGGCPVHPGDEIVLPQWVVHRDPRWWGDDAEVFRAQRWLTGGSDGACTYASSAPGHPASAYFPFGGGRRICIGEQFARVEAVLALATLARHWAPTLQPGWVVQEEALLTLRPKGGLPMELVPR